MKAIKIDEFGKMTEITTEYVSDILNKTTINYGVLETYFLYDINEDDNIVKLNIIGNTNEFFAFNRYEFQHCNPRGVVFIVLFKLSDNSFGDINISDFLEFYEDNEELDNSILTDEIEDIICIDQYDYTSEFLEDDREDSD